MCCDLGGFSEHEGLGGGALTAELQTGHWLQIDPRERLPNTNLVLKVPTYPLTQLTLRRNLSDTRALVVFTPLQAHVQGTSGYDPSHKRNADICNLCTGQEGELLVQHTYALGLVSLFLVILQRCLGRRS